MQHEFAPSGMEIEDAEEVASILQTRLAELVDLSLTLKHVHWNVVGPGFITVHKLMDEQTASTRNLIDEVAERITTLGGVAAGLAGQVIEMRDSEDDYALGRAPVMAHLGALDKVYERVGKGHREAAAQIGDLDLVSQDLLIGQSSVLEANHWFIRAHLADTEGRLATKGTQTELDAGVAATYMRQPDMMEDQESKARESADAKAMA